VPSSSETTLPLVLLEMSDMPVKVMTLGKPAAPVATIGFFESGEALGVVSLVVHPANEGVGAGGGADQSDAFKEGKFFGGEEFDARDAEVLGVLNELGVNSEVFDFGSKVHFFCGAEFLSVVGRW